MRNAARPVAVRSDGFELAVAPLRKLAPQHLVWWRQRVRDARVIAVAQHSLDLRPRPLQVLGEEVTEVDRQCPRSPALI